MTVTILVEDEKVDEDGGIIHIPNGEAMQYGKVTRRSSQVGRNVNYHL